MKKFYKVILNRTFFVLFFLLLLVVVASGNHKTNNFVNNINGVRSIEAIHIVSKYDNRNNQLKVIPVSNMSEALQYGPTNPISFVGEMTAYQANCAGCSGKVGCPPRQDVRNNNIYFEDVTYGTVRILAADMAIPCGSNDWEIVRLGADIKLKCANCGRLIFMPRIEFNKKLKKVISKEGNNAS